MRKVLVAFVVLGVLSVVPAHAGVARFSFKHAVKPVAHASVKAGKAVERAVVKSAKFALKVLY